MTTKILITTPCLAIDGHPLVAGDIVDAEEREAKSLIQQGHAMLHESNEPELCIVAANPHNLVVIANGQGMCSVFADPRPEPIAWARMDGIEGHTADKHVDDGWQEKVEGITIVTTDYSLAWRPFGHPPHLTRLNADERIVAELRKLDDWNDILEKERNLDCNLF